MSKTVKRNIKPVNKLIVSKLIPFIAYHKFDDIIVLGSSISEVDRPYFEEIIKRNKNAKWTISYYAKNGETVENCEDICLKEKFIKENNLSCNLEEIDTVLKKITIDFDV